MNSELNPAELRKKYFQYLEMQLPRRAKGVPYQKIIGPSGLAWLFLGLFVCPFLGLAFGWGRYLIDKHPIVIIALGAMTFVLLILPEFFYHERNRTRRWAKRRYPHVYRKIYHFNERNKKDRMAVGLRLLKVGGQGYFLGPYVRQRLWEKQAALTGYVLLTEAGEVVEDEDLFEKTFLTYNYGIIGAVSGQNTAIGERWSLTEDLKIYMPRAERALRIQKNYFEQSGHLYDLQNLLEYMPDLYVAARDALTIYDGREKFRKAMGYSFGYGYLYEDAVLEFEMRQSFCKYMLVAHFKTINNIRALSARLIEDIKNDGGMAQKPIAVKALEKIWTFAFNLSNLIDKMAQEGIPSEEDRRLFREKTAFAKTISEPIGG